MMKKFRRITVQSFFPEELKQLQDFSYNLWWSWKPKAQKLFKQLDEKLWYEVEHNPLKLFKHIGQDQLNKKNQDPEFNKLFKEVMSEFENYMTRQDTWFNTNYPNREDFLIAYFSAEFGVHETVPVYSGGLGVLAGDHCKAASDLGVPLVGVGMMYKQGYFIQQIDADGWQKALYPSHDFGEIPITLVNDEEGLPIKISLNMPGRKVYAQIWQMIAGRTVIYLLDSDLQENLPEDRMVTSQLYGGDNEMRITQELLLGIGGVRALRAMGYNPTVWHMNEGHSAFLVLERIREYIEKGYSFDIARELVGASSVFTTHTPVPAGHDAFNRELMLKYFGECHPLYGLEWENFYKLGKDANDLFSMTILALKISKSANGVSKLHGEVSRKLWSEVFHEIPEDEVPITYVTNGVHTETWLSREFRKLYNEYINNNWLDRLDDLKIWEAVDTIPSAKLWETHLHRKQRLSDVVRQKIENRNRRNGVPAHITARMLESLLPKSLFIGFARRFATYKRATLLFKDRERLKKLLNNKDRPIVLFYAGKAHPADRPGQEFIREINKLAFEDDFIGKIIILENYNLSLARYLVSGVDIWLNTPRRPREASGTSGQKVPINGGINWSVMDGWWVEGYNQKNGWTIGEPKEYASNDIQDHEDSASIYYTLENSILPEYFEFNKQGYSEAWVQRMRESIKSVLPKFSTARMVKDYVNRIYIPAGDYSEKIRTKDYKAAIELVEWKRKIINEWTQVWITEINPHEEFTNELQIRISAEIKLGNLKPDDVIAEVYMLRDGFEQEGPVLIQELTLSSRQSNDRYLYNGTIDLPNAGTYKYSVRVRPYHKSLHHPFEMRLIRWMEIADY
ncbi:MAG TPA: alpha-glucan family phosphorylase [Candidatus Marinimicrobia bacterium]|nr:alpha-glucan family phosphorylase [Candidatus Neomarinimicrobiota bacterium]